MTKFAFHAAGVSATALLFALSTPAVAQNAAPAAPQADAAVTTDATQDTGAQIVVTAQGRSQTLASVPVDIRQLNQLAPSLLVSSTGSEANGSARIRGIGTVGDNPGLESSVPVFIDGVYRSRSGIGLNELGEIERIEVQRGPQGTLGGRNSSAGLISIYSKKPSFTFGATGEATYGNYNYARVAGSVTGPISETIAARLDGVYVRRDGFLHDVVNNIDVNNRDRFFLRGQLLFQPSSDFSVRLIGDYTYRNERCCGASYVDASVNPYVGNLNNLSTPLAPLQTNGNNIVNVLRDLGQPVASFNPGYSRDIYVSPGRSFAGKTKDYGGSAEINWNLGGAKLTSITGYREYRSGQGSDTDYSAVDLLYRADSAAAYRQFHTFTQELRLQGKALDGKLDWLIGGFYANEKLTLTDNLRFGKQYGRFATCRIISGGGLAGLYSPNSPSCVVPGVGQATLAGASGVAGPDIVAAFAALDGISDKGSTIDRYFQQDNNFAIFTHDILHLTDKLDLTLGARYTWDKKKLNATFGNDNTACPQIQNLVLGDLTSATTNATAKALAGALIGLGCQGNSTSELNGVSISSSKPREQRFTGTAILSYKITPRLLTYASFSRGYKAGGFNLDRSALKSPITPFAAVPGGAQALADGLQFDPELVNAYEIGAKYASGPFSLSATAFRSDFTNFQLNTFNGSVFLVQTINGCKSSLNGGDRDLSAATGVCPAGQTGYGVRTQGFELESVLVPARDFRVTAGFTYSSTKYRDNLVGNRSGAPLDPALRVLPGSQLSNAPKYTVTGSAAWTPEIGTSGYSLLFYVDTRLVSDYNTGSDLFPQKGQDSFALVNGRIGLRGPNDHFAIELWAQNLTNKQYAQVAFNSPFQAGTTSAPFVDPQYPGGRQIFSQFLAEPRTFGVTVRGKF
jgi:iron complex outermembrane receptor protein